MDILRSVYEYVKKRNTGVVGEYTMCHEGEITLYSSCFASMVLHHINRLNEYSGDELEVWSRYINHWQERETGYFIGPEITRGDLTSSKHAYDHVAMHLTAHVLPALALMNSSPRYPLYFAHRFLNEYELREWLNARDWRDAWLEGNNLLFLGQFLIHLRDVEGIESASNSLEIYFEWLGKEIDPKTGLWGTNGYCSPFVAMCGGFHQLLVYYYENQEVRFKERLVDTVLRLQHPDGGFSPNGGGGACEDVDAADILVNMYKMNDYRRRDIRIALRRLLRSIRNKQKEDGGFVYRLNEAFIHNGIRKTYSPPNVSNLFATWFHIFIFALINEIIHDEHIFNNNHFNFNKTCSMGWHRPWEKSKHVVGRIDSIKEIFEIKYKYTMKRALRQAYNLLSRNTGSMLK